MTWVTAMDWSNQEWLQSMLVTDISDHIPAFCMNKTIAQWNINITYTHNF